MKRIFLVVFALLLANTTMAQKMDRDIKSTVYMPKGQWFVGGTASYFEANGEDYKFLMIDDLQTKAYTLTGKVQFAYTFTNDIAAGLALDYSRTQVQIDDVSINLSEDMIFGIEDYYSVRHVYTATAFLRTYLALGESKRFALFNDVRFNFGGGQGKIYNGVGQELVGTYEKITQMGVTISPGLSAFVTNSMSIEASVGILGVNYNRTEQITNQVYQGSFETVSANFKVNLFSIQLGMSFYF